MNHLKVGDAPPNTAVGLMVTGEPTQTVSPPTAATVADGVPDVTTVMVIAVVNTLSAVRQGALLVYLQITMSPLVGT